MKANELMIGDQVYVVKDYFKDSFKIKRKEILKIDAFDLHRISHGLLEVEPIPPTPEILEKNGWVKKDIIDTYWVAVYEYKDRYKPVDIWEDVYGYMIVTIGLVEKQIYSSHELQHLLRLCGITEVADNFKI